MVVDAFIIAHEKAFDTIILYFPCNKNVITRFSTLRSAAKKGGRALKDLASRGGACRTKRRQARPAARLLCAVFMAFFGRLTDTVLPIA